MSRYVIELHTRSTKRGRAEVLDEVVCTRREARRIARTYRGMYDGTITERWIAP